MKLLSKKYLNRIHLYFGILLIYTQLNNCSPLLVKEANLIQNFQRNEARINSLVHLIVKSSIIIDSPDNEGKLYGTYSFSFPDSLKIQFRDPIGRKQALMNFFGEEFELWMQRENNRYNRDEIPQEFSLFVFKELEMSEIRKLFLGRPLFPLTKKMKSDSIESKSFRDIKLVTYLNSEKNIRRVEIFENNEDISSIFIYKEWQICDEIFFPGELEIVDIDSGIQLKIKLYHFSPEYYILSAL